MTYGYDENGMGLGWDGELDLIRDESLAALNLVETVQTDLYVLGFKNNLIERKLLLAEAVLREFIRDDLDDVIRRILNEAYDSGARYNSPNFKERKEQDE